MTTLANIAVILLWIGGSIALVLGTLMLARRLMPPPPGHADAEGNLYPGSVRDMAAAAGFRIAALYSIILALVYAQELHDYQDVRAGLSREAVAVAQVYHDAIRFGGEDAEQIQRGIAAYARLVVEREWEQLSREQSLSPQAWGMHDLVLDTVLDLKTQSPREESLRARMLTNMHRIGDLRQLRKEQVADAIPWVFWLPAVAGMVVVSVPFFAFPSRRETHVLLACFGAFAGLILFFIYAFANPYSQPFRVEPKPFVRLLETDMGKAAALAPLPAVGGVAG
jgi:Protein of unknown function (DUF4239)